MPSPLPLFDTDWFTTISLILIGMVPGVLIGASFALTAVGA